MKLARAALISLAGAVALAGSAFLAVTQPLERAALLGTPDAESTFRGLAEATSQARGAARSGRLHAGWASRTITPPVGTPTLGYGARRGRGTTAVADELEAHALALAVGDGPPLVVLSADLCFWSTALSGRIANALSDVVPRERLFFGATHTHNGPGGWIRAPAVEFSMGAYQDEVFERIAREAVDGVRDAIDRLAPAEYRARTIDAKRWIENRSRPGVPLDDRLLALELRQADAARFALVVYAAHATAIGPSLVVSSGDYPGALVRGLRARGYRDALFLAAGTGQAGPRWRGETANAPDIAVAHALGDALAEAVDDASQSDDSPWSGRAMLAAMRSRVALPPWRVRLAGRELRPELAEWLVAQPPIAHVDALRLDDVVFVGHSFEFSATLARDLVRQADEQGIRLAVTSFNGDHAFYVVPESDYDLPVYESGMTMFGPGLGPYLARITDRAWRGLRPRPTAGSHRHAGR